MNRFLASALLLLIGSVSCSQHASREPAPDGPPADLIVLNAKVWTADPEFASAEAFAIRGGRFTAVGDERSVSRSRGSATRIIDAGGKRIVPGLCDAHMHFISGGLQLSRLNLRDVADRAEFIRRIGDKARKAKRGEWLRGGRWSTESWPDPTQPNKTWIDPVTGSVPVLLARMDGHGALANSAALSIAGIDRAGPPDPPGGEIVRDSETNEPTGILRDSAIGLVSRHAPRTSLGQEIEAIQAATAEAHRHGITMVHTMSSWSDVGPLRAAQRAGDLPLRIRLYVNEDDWTVYLGMVKQLPGDDWFRIPGFKQFMDGSLGSRTAYMAAPFADNPPEQPDRRGLLSAVMQTEGKLQRLCAAADSAGFDPAVHAIGDQGNHLLLDIYEAVSKANGPRAGRRMRVEHAQHLLPADIARFAGLGVTASMQPLHKADDGRYAEQAIGTARCRTSYAFRDLLDAGANLAFGSDWPVVTLNPFRGMHAAVTGKTLDGETFVPEQNISVEEALRAYTAGAAYAAGDEDRLGRIRAGFLADFVILEDDVLAVPADCIGEVRVKQTFVEGRPVWPARVSR